MRILVLTALVVISAALTISAECRGPKRNVYFFKPLTTILIILLAAIPKYPVPAVYRYLIIAGLVFSLAGDVFLMLPSDRFILGLLSFLVAHLFYIAAFMFAGSGATSKLVGAVLLIYGCLMLWRLWPTLGHMKTPVVVYTLAILLMALMAVSWYLKGGREGSYLAAVGAIVFVASDSILAFNRFKGSFRGAQFLILTTYFTAQSLIALST